VARLARGGVAPPDDTLFQERYLSLHEEANGMFRLRGLLDPVTAAPLKTALDALVGDALRRRASAPCSVAGGEGASAGAGECEGEGAPSLREASGQAVVEDRRSIPQILADSLYEIAHHALGCAGAPTPLTKTTVVVRMSLDALTDRLGTAEIDGVDRPISAASARSLAVDAEVIPAVFGGDSMPLDLGRAARLFTRAQRIALAERDGGCASCGQNVTYAHAHHIDWWTRDAGPTDLENGVMLCGFCHRQVHREGWRIRADRSSVWFIPPPHVDPSQRARLGGRARFDLVARHVA
jgi:5-methylcytosine-specific restriction protein A